MIPCFCNYHNYLINLYDSCDGNYQDLLIIANTNRGISKLRKKNYQKAKQENKKKKIV